MNDASLHRESGCGRTLSQRFPKLPSWTVRAFGDDPLFALAFVISGLVAILGVIGNLDPANDVASCYARQVREFAAGNWEGAFFHMTPPLLIILAGILAKFLWIPPFAALKIVSGAMLVASLWPLRRLLRRTLPPEWVPYGCLMFCACGRLARYATMGLLDAPKAFILLWIAAFLCDYAEKPAVRRAVWIGIWSGALALTRAEGVFFFPGIGLAMLALPLYRPPVGMARRVLTARILGHGVLIGIIILTISLPQILYMYRVTGYPALDSRQSWKVRTLLADVGLAEQPGVDFFRNAVAEKGSKVKPVDPDDVKTFGRSIREAIKGLDREITALAFLGLIIILWRRRWSCWDTVCVGVVVYNTLMFLANGFVTKRYTTPTCPFLLPYMVQGLFFLKEKVFDRLKHRAWIAFLGILLIIGFWNGLSRVRSSLHDGDSRERAIGLWILERRDCFQKEHPIALQSDSVKNEYHDGRQPLIAATRPQVAYWAKADWVPVDGRFTFTWDHLSAYLLAYHVDLLVVDSELLQSCPELIEKSRQVLPVTGTPEDWGVAIFRLDDLVEGTRK